MWNRPMRTDYRLWTAFTLLLFILAGSVDWVPKDKSPSYWLVWGIFLSGNYGAQWDDFLFALVMYGLLLLVPSVMVAWVLQALSIVVVDIARPMAHKAE